MLNPVQSQPNSLVTSYINQKKAESSQSNPGPMIPNTPPVKKNW